AALPRSAERRATTPIGCTPGWCARCGSSRASGCIRAILRTAGATVPTSRAGAARRTLQRRPRSSKLASARRAHALDLGERLAQLDREGAEEIAAARAVARLAGLFERGCGTGDAGGSDCLRRAPQLVGGHRQRCEIAGMR